MANDPNPVDVLRGVAKRYRGRVSHLNLHDPNVCTSAFDWREALGNAPPPADRFRHQVKLRHDGRAMAVRANDRFVAVEAKGTCGSDVPFSINRPDRVMMMSRTLTKREGRKNWRVFVDTNSGWPSVLDQPAIARGVDALDLGVRESLHVYRNGLTAYIEPTSVQRVVGAVVAVAALASQLPTTNTSVDVSDLPGEFLPLVPLLARWANSDDQERTEQLARTSSVRLEDLVVRVAPHFTSINRHLDQFRSRNMPESALALGTLAECATEAQVLIASRRVDDAVPTPRLQPTAAKRRAKKRAPRRRG